MTRLILLLLFVTLFAFMLVVPLNVMSALPRPSHNNQKQEKHWSNQRAFPSTVQAWATRLHPGQDLQDELVHLALEHKLEAVSIQTCVGSLTHLALRMANRPNITYMQGFFEIGSLVGTISNKGEPHLHMIVSDSEGRTIGGHVVSGNKIYTTAEIVMTELKDLIFVREIDPETTYDELHIKTRK